MDEIKMEREIKEMLHQCADELHAPDSMQARVKFALNNAPARKRHLWSKRFVAVAAVAAIAVTGAFAAGGMGGGMVAFLGGRLQMGIETVLDTVGFDKLLEGADMVFSGEGKLDAQSLLGKVVIGVARRAKRAGVPLVAVVGDIGDNIEAAYDMGVSAVFSINRVAVPFREAKPRSKSDLALTMDNLMRFCRRMGW